MKRLRRRAFVGFMLILSLAMFSCRTMPRPPYPDVVQWIPSDSDLILRFDVEGNEDLAELLISVAGLDPAELESAVERTALLAAGLDLGADRESFDDVPIHAVVIGKWPRGVLGSALGKDWKRNRSERYQWYGPEGLSLAAPSNEVLLLSRGSLDELLGASEDPPDNTPTSRFPGNSDFGLLIRDAGFIGEIVPMASGRIDAISVELVKSASGYSVGLSIFPTDERLTGSLALALRIGLSARFGMSPKPEERELFSVLDVEMGPGEIRMFLPDLELDLMSSIVREMNIFPGSEE